MKKLLITSLAAALVAIPVATQTTQAQPPEFELRIGPRGERGDPNLFKALNELEKARRHLLESRRGYGGRKDAALRSTEDAIAQVRAILAWQRGERF
jgi:hypothetical protein